MTSEPPTAPTRRWYRLHWVTWLFVIVEIGALGYCQSIWTRGPAGGTNHWHYSFSLSGWPIVNCRHYLSTYAGPANTTEEYEWYTTAMVINCVFSLLLVTSTAMNAEARMRRPQRWQFSLLGLLKLTTVVAVVLTLMVRRREIYEAVLGIGLRPGQVPEIDPPLAPLIWPIKVIILFGLGCTIYSLGTFAEFSARSLWKFARRDKETLPPG